MPKGDGAETDRSYLDQVLLMYESAYEGPKRRPEGGEWEPIKFFLKSEVRLKIPSVHPTQTS